MFAIHIIGKEHGLDLVRFVVAVEKFSEAPGQEHDQLRNLIRRNAKKSLAHTKQIAPSSQAPGADLRGRLQEEGLQVARQFFELIVHAHKLAGVFCGNLAEFLLRPLAVRPPRQHLAVGEGNLDRRITGHHLQSVVRKMKILNDLRPQHAGNVGRGRDPTSGRDLFGHAASAHNFAAFEDQSGQPPAGEICRRGQPVVPSANHNRVVDSLGSRCHLLNDQRSLISFRRHHTLPQHGEKLN